GRHLAGKRRAERIRMKIAEARRGLGYLMCALVLSGVLSWRGVVPLPGVAAAASQDAAKALVLRVDAAQSKVHLSLGSTLHTVHGTFTVKSGEIRLDPASGKAGGEIVIDAASGESGNDGRDKKMHGEIIESAKYKEIAFRPDRVDGKLPAQGNVTAQIHGIFLLHGGEAESIGAG